MYPAELVIKGTTERYTSASYLDLLLSIGRDGQLHTSISQTFHSWVAIFHLRQSMAFLSHSSYDIPGLAPLINALFLRAVRLSSKILGQGLARGRLKSFLRKFYGRYGDLIKLYEVSLSRHSGTWPYTVTPSIDQILHQFVNLLRNSTLLIILTLLPYFGSFRAMQKCNGCG